MSELLDYKKDILRCTRCGLCQSVCPVYKVEKNECTVSKGKFNILYGVLKGDLRLNQKVLKNIDLCLNCSACTDFCPLGIDAVEIFATVKHEFRTQCKSVGFFSNFLSPTLLRAVFILLGFGAKTYRILGFDRFNLSVFSVFNSVLKINSKRKALLEGKKANIKVAYFQGCVNKYINPSVKNASLNLLERAGVYVDILDFDCCGVMFKTSGDFESFEKLKKHNLFTLENTAYDYVLFDCETCICTFKSYFKPVQAPVNYLSVVEFLETQNLMPELDGIAKVTYHKPCHQKYLPSFLGSLKNVEYVEAEDYDSCCGFAGAFALKHNKISQAIAESKAQKFSDTKSGCIVTACPSCVLGLAQGQYLTSSKTPIITVTELLDKLSN